MWFAGFARTVRFPPLAGKWKSSLSSGDVRDLLEVTLIQAAKAVLLGIEVPSSKLCAGCSRCILSVHRFGLQGISTLPLTTALSVLRAEE